MLNILVVDNDKYIRESFKMVLGPENGLEIASSREEDITKTAINQVEEKKIVIKANKAGEILDDEKHFIKLFISGQPSEYKEMIESLRKMFDDNLKYYELEVINVIRNPELAKKDNIIATPTIVKYDCNKPRMIDNRRYVYY